MVGKAPQPAEHAKNGATQLSWATEMGSTDRMTSHLLHARFTMAG